MASTRSKRFSSTNKRGIQWSKNTEPWGRALSRLRVSLVEVVLRIDGKQNIRWPFRIRELLRLRRNEKAAIENSTKEKRRFGLKKMAPTRSKIFSSTNKGGIQ